jgi:hypothetical protein
MHIDELIELHNIQILPSSDRLIFDTKNIKRDIAISDFGVYQNAISLVVRFNIDWSISIVNIATFSYPPENIDNDSFLRGWEIAFLYKNNYFPDIYMLKIFIDEDKYNSYKHQGVISWLSFDEVQKIVNDSRKFFDEYEAE